MRKGVIGLAYATRVNWKSKIGRKVHITRVALIGRKDFGASFQSCSLCSPISGRSSPRTRAWRCFTTFHCSPCLTADIMRQLRVYITSLCGCESALTEELYACPYIGDWSVAGFHRYGGVIIHIHRRHTRDRELSFVSPCLWIH